MPARKRTYEEVDSSSDSIPEVSAELSTLTRIRGMWEFAAFMQYLFFFGKAVKVEDLDVEVSWNVPHVFGHMDEEGVLMEYEIGL